MFYVKVGVKVAQEHDQLIQCGEPCSESQHQKRISELLQEIESLQHKAKKLDFFLTIARQNA